jgi:PAS domain-containing protein
VNGRSKKIASLERTLAELRRASVRARALGAVGVALVTFKSSGKAVDRTLDIVAEQFDWAVGVYWAVDEGAQILRFCAEPCARARTGVLHRVGARVRLLARRRPCRRRLGTGQVRWSASPEKLHGLEPGTFARPIEAVVAEVHPDDRQRFHQTVNRALRTGKPYAIEYRAIGPDGVIRRLQARGRVFYDAEGKPERLLGVCMRSAEQAAAL